MMKYLANHHEDFSETMGPFQIAVMQFIGAFFTEIINILVICSCPTIMDVIMNFIALGAISEIDNYYLASLPVCTLKDALEVPLEVKRKSGDIKHRPCKPKFVRIVYRTLRIFQVSFYYYFTPFLAVILTYLAGGTRN